MFHMDLYTSLDPFVSGELSFTYVPVSWSTITNKSKMKILGNEFVFSEHTLHATTVIRDAFYLP